ncbi:MAG TPA: sugar ABC transporter [Propionibacteriaceae bacterium]|nr:sugar ABC transporter [Propionibacteriaceae bacterium]
MKTLRFVLLVAFVASLLLVAAPAVAQEPEYTYYFVSHIGPDDPNMKWLTVSTEEISKLLPVKVNYVAAEKFSVEQQVKNLEAAIAAEPDGLIVPITDPKALEGPLKEAIALGIPVIASNISDPRDAPDKIPYLTYVGGDEYLTGVKIGERMLKEFADQGKTLTRAVCANAAPGHVGIQMRCKGMKDVMDKAGVAYEELPMDPEPTKIYDTWAAYLEGHPDTNAVWAAVMLATPNIFKATKDAGREGEVVIASVDESPLSVEGIVRGHLLATHSQQFYLQGWVPVEWLYIYNRFGYMPPPELLTGPVIIDASNAEAWKATLMTVLGEDVYNDLAGWEAVE